MKTLTNLALTFSIILIFTLTSCINDSEEIIASENIITTELVETNQSELKTKDVIEVEVTKEPAFQEKIKEKAIIKTEPKEINKEEISEVKPEEKVIEKKELVKLSESVDLNTDRNQSYNPDNANAPLELEDKDNNITLKPIFSATDMAKYYVVFKESHEKINRKEISKLITTGKVVYIANHQGIYKYCVGQSENENDAKAFKAKFDKEQNNTSSTVSTFSSAW